MKGAPPLFPGGSRSWVGGSLVVLLAGLGTGLDTSTAAV
jgi:hypothetical protein